MNNTAKHATASFLIRSSQEKNRLVKDDVALVWFLLQPFPELLTLPDMLIRTIRENNHKNANKKQY
ncbi:MAG: hypothetical protein AB1696_28895 [Planctomycetota bacterium]